MSWNTTQEVQCCGGVAATRPLQALLSLLSLNWQSEPVWRVSGLPGNQLLKQVMCILETQHEFASSVSDCVSLLYYLFLSWDLKCEVNKQNCITAAGYNIDLRIFLVKRLISKDRACWDLISCDLLSKLYSSHLILYQCRAL